jgi:hypothetical protein
MSTSAASRTTAFAKFIEESALTAPMFLHACELTISRVREPVTESRVQEIIASHKKLYKSRRESLRIISQELLSFSQYTDALLDTTMRVLNITYNEVSALLD